MTKAQAILKDAEKILLTEHAATPDSADGHQLSAAIGKTSKTLRARLRNPGELTVAEYVALCRKLHIPIADARDAIRY